MGLKLSKINLFGTKFTNYSFNISLHNNHNWEETKPIKQHGLCPTPFLIVHIFLCTIVHRGQLFLLLGSDSPVKSGRPYSEFYIASVHKPGAERLVRRTILILQETGHTWEQHKRYRNSGFQTDPKAGGYQTEHQKLEW